MEEGEVPIGMGETKILVYSREEELSKFSDLGEKDFGDCRQAALVGNEVCAVSHLVTPSRGQVTGRDRENDDHDNESTF